MMWRLIEDGLVQIRSPMVCNYLLIDEERRSASLIDSGFFGALDSIEAALGHFGLGWESLENILMTHGHLDHMYLTRAEVELSGARVFAHPMEGAHLAGKYPYRGLATVCGGLEAAGRFLLGFRPVEEFEPLADGQELDIWGGLEVIHCPGHTNGHCGFFSRSRRLFFSGDLFLNTWWRVMTPWPWLNTRPEVIPSGLERALALPMEGLLANHCDMASPQEQLRRFRRFMKR